MKTFPEPAFQWLPEEEKPRGLGDLPDEDFEQIVDRMEQLRIDQDAENRSEKERKL